MFINVILISATAMQSANRYLIALMTQDGPIDKPRVPILVNSKKGKGNLASRLSLKSHVQVTHYYKNVLKLCLKNVLKV